MAHTFVLLFHIVAFDIKALVIPSHQFVYTPIIPCGRLAIQPGHDSILQVFIIVALDIKSLVVPWHQFVYTLVIPCGRLAIQPGHDSNLHIFFIVAFNIKILVIQLHKAIFQHHTEHQKLQQNRCVDCVHKLS